MRLMVHAVIAAFLAGAAGVQGSDVPTATATNAVALTAIGSNVTEIVRDTHSKPVVGEKTDERITARLRRVLLNQKIAETTQTNLLVDVNCGDPIYHVSIQVGGGIITNITLRLTPICWYDSAR